MLRAVVWTRDDLLASVSSCLPLPGGMGQALSLNVVGRCGGRSAVMGIVVITKIDLDSHADLNLRFRDAGYPVWPVSIRTGDGLDALAAEVGRNFDAFDLALNHAQ